MFSDPGITRFEFYHPVSWKFRSLNPLKYRPGNSVLQDVFDRSSMITRRFHPEFHYYEVTEIRILEHREESNSCLTRLRETKSEVASSLANNRALFPYYYYIMPYEVLPLTYEYLQLRVMCQRLIFTLFYMHRNVSNVDISVNE